MSIEEACQFHFNTLGAILSFDLDSQGGQNKENKDLSSLEDIQSMMV